MEQFAVYARQELADLQAQMVQVQQQIALLQQTYAGLQAQMDALATYVAVAAPAAMVPAPHVTVVTRIVTLLQRAAEPLHYKEIARRLETEEGYTMTGKDPHSNMTSRLCAAPEFVRVAPGTYTLRDMQAPR